MFGVSNGKSRRQNLPLIFTAQQREEPKRALCSPHFNLWFCCSMGMDHLYSGDMRSPCWSGEQMLEESISRDVHHQQEKEKSSQGLMFALTVDPGMFNWTDPQRNSGTRLWCCSSQKPACISQLPSSAASRPTSRAKISLNNFLSQADMTKKKK